MGLRFDPIGGGQFKQAVKQIIEAEAQPIKALEARKTQEEAKMKLFQELKGKFTSVDKALGELTSFSKFRELKADLGDGTNFASVTLDKDKAQPGSYSIRIDDLAARTSIISNGFSSADDNVLGIGFVVMKSPEGGTKEIYVGEDNANLHGVANLINQQADSPVRAAVVKDSSDLDSPWKIIVTAKKDGAGNQVSFPDFYFLDGEKDLFIEDQKDAHNAIVQMNGFPIEIESNEMNEFLPGVNLHLKQANPDKPFTLNITEDTQKVSGKVKGLVDQLNGVLDFVNKQNQVDEKSDTRNTFAGDTSLQGMEYRIRNLLHEGFGNGVDPDSDDFRIVHLSELGVEFNKDGQLALKEDKFNKALEKDFDGVAAAITGSFGFAFQLGELFKGYTRSGDGMLAMRETSMRGRIKSIDDQIDRKTKNLEVRQQALTDKFSRLEGSLSDLQRQQQSLSASMPAGGGNNLVAQLLGG